MLSLSGNFEKWKPQEGIRGFLVIFKGRKGFDIICQFLFLEIKSHLIEPNNYETKPKFRDKNLRLIFQLFKVIFLLLSDSQPFNFKTTSQSPLINEAF